MAFVCTLRGSFLPVVATYPTLTSLVYPIGYDDADGSPYRLYIGFGTAPGGIIEYSFCVTHDPKGGEPRDLWDSQEVAAVIPKDDRALILRLLLDATVQMIRSQRFPEVTMHTFSRDLPPKALVKYSYIAQLFTNEGYRVRRLKRHGQNIWWFERKTAKRAKRPSVRRPRRHSKRRGTE